MLNVRVLCNKIQQSFNIFLYINYKLYEYRIQGLSIGIRHLYIIPHAYDPRVCTVHLDANSLYTNFRSLSQRWFHFITSSPHTLGRKVSRPGELRMTILYRLKKSQVNFLAL